MEHFQTLAGFVQRQLAHPQNIQAHDQGFADLALGLNPGQAETRLRSS